MSNWQTPITTWGQAGKTVPVAGDFNRIEGNTQYLKDEIDSHKADFAILQQFMTTGGTANALTVDTGGEFNRQIDGNILPINPSLTNTGAATIAEDGHSPAAIKKYDIDADAYVDLEAGDIKKNNPIVLRWSVSNGFFALAPKGGGSNIKNIQYIERNWIIADGTVTSIPITPVDPNNSIIYLYTRPRDDRLNGQYGTVEFGGIPLGSEVILKRYKNLPYDSYAPDLLITIVEFKNVKSKQSGTVWFSTDDLVKTVSISAVDWSKSIISITFRGGYFSGNYDHTIATMFPSCKLISNNQLEFARRSAGTSNYKAQAYVNYEIIEFN